MKNHGSTLKMIFALVIFGTIGIFVRNIPLPSSIIALVRGSVGMLFLLAVICIKRQRLSLDAIRKNALWLVFSGTFLGFNWILLFESYHYTTVATSTLCYYMAPILVILASPILLKERLTAKKILCVLAALLGMVCISGVLQTGIPTPAEGKGILLGLAAAVLYAAIVLMNKQIHDISAYDKTILQLGISALVLLPYCAFTVSPDALTLTPYSLGLLLLVAILHTGVAYYLYFGSIEYISGQTAAIISYIDPVIAVLASVLILKEPLLLTEGLGALLILGAALCSELSPGKAKEGA
mgnify:CR=1 FL=1